MPRVLGKAKREPGRSGKPASSEFVGLKLNSNRAAVYHCKDHRHSTGMRGLGGRRAPEYLPLFPYVRAVSIIERLHGDIRLEDTGYRSTADDVEGTITVEMTHSDWQEPLRRYRKKHGIADGAPVDFSAGLAMLTGKVGLTFAASQPLVLANGAGLWFRGESAGHDLFANVPGRPEGAWSPTVTYRLKEGRAPRGIPLWIVPSITPRSDQRALEIDLHWNQLSKDAGPSLEVFDRVQLNIPAEWGNMQSADPDTAVTTAPAEGVKLRVVEWRQVVPTLESQGRRSCVLKISFENPIPPESQLSGRVEATFKGTLSGVSGVGVYLPGGRHDRGDLKVKPKTVVSADFTISLDDLRYQDDRVVPDENNEKDLERSRSDEFPGVVPDYGVIIALTNAISAEDYYVKSVVEQLPHRDDARADVVNHVWDIAGRSYDGVFPIDFDISLRGEEIQGRSGAAAGKTAVQIKVKGAFATGGSADGALLWKIENRWDDLHAKVVKALADYAVLPDGAWPSNGAGSNAGSELMISVSPIPVSPAPVLPAMESREPRAIEGAEIIDSAVFVAEPIQGSTDKRNDLRRQWKDADDAVMAGRISEGVYRMMVARIVSELRDLGEDLGE